MNKIKKVKNAVGIPLYPKYINKMNQEQKNAWVQSILDGTGKPNDFEVVVTPEGKFFMVEKKEEDQDNLPIIYDKDLRNYEPPKYQYIINDLIPKNSVGLIVGKRGERKTYLILYYAICIASGLDVFGNYKVPEKQKVLIIDEETGIDEIKKRVDSMKKGLGIEDQDLEIAYLSFYGLKLDLEDKQIKIKKFLEEFKPSVIFVDCFQRVLSFNIDKENHLISEFLTSFIRESVLQYNLTWVFVHHYRKPTLGKKPDDWLDEIRGGSELTNYCRFVFGLKRIKGKNRENDDIIIKQLKMSNAQPSSDKVISFILNDDSLKVEFLGEAEDILTADKLCANAIKEWILEEGIKSQITTKEIKEASPGGYGSTNISAGINILIEDGFLTRIKKGIYQLKKTQTIQTKLKKGGK